MVPDPLPLAYAVYAFINVDNCERSLTGPHKDKPETVIQNILRTVKWDHVSAFDPRQLVIHNFIPECIEL